MSRESTARPPRGGVAGVVLLALLAARCAPPPRAANERCIFSDDCTSGLICAAGYCRVECRDDRDCVNRWRCTAAGVPSKRVCIPPDAPSPCLYHSDCVPAACAADPACVPNQQCSVDGVCRVQCREARDCQGFQVSLSCEPDAGVCLWPSELGSGSGP